MSADILKYEDIIKIKEYRIDIENRLKNVCNDYDINKLNKYLYKYVPFSQYSIENICNNDFQLSSLSLFNDTMEGLMNIKKSRFEIEKQSLKEFENQQHLFPNNSFAKSLGSIINLNQSINDNAQKRANHFLNSLGTYIGCLSEYSNSILMWAHYSNLGTGISIEYDFNQYSNTSLIHKMLFPVCYSSKPVYLGDLIDDKYSRKICEFPLDVATLCSLLNKKIDWSYEKEWRIIYIFDLQGISKDVERIKIKKFTNTLFKPSAILFGTRFINNFLDINEEKNKSNFLLLDKLKNYIVANNIKAYFMFNTSGTFDLVKKEIDILNLVDYINQECGNNRRQYLESINDIWISKNNL